jgi:glycosyltransferase involved in cell wall biosynthesis
VTELPGPGSEPRRLLHVFPSFAVGGSQIRFAKLVKLHGSRYQHSVISLDGNLEMAPRIADANVACEILDRFKGGFVANTLSYRKVLARKRPDILVTYNWGAIEWALANRLLPLARHIHIEDGFGREEVKTQITRRIWMRRLALSGRSSTIVVPSKRLEDIALGAWKLNRKQLVYVPNGVDCVRFTPADRAPGDDIQIGTVAGLRPEKNVARLITAFDALATRHPHLRLVIVGDGPDRAALEGMVQALASRERIRFIGESATPEQVMRQMDIFALSSDTEQMPLSVLEAMASGLPVVSTDVGDVARMVSPQNRSFIVNPHDFAAALEHLVQAEKERRDIGAANRGRALELFSETRMADRYAALFG